MSCWQSISSWGPGLPPELEDLPSDGLLNVSEAPVAEELSTLWLSSIMAIDLGWWECASNNIISDLGFHATWISSSGGVGGSIAGYS